MARKRRRFNQTDSKSRKLHKAARKQGTSPTGVAVFLIRDSPSTKKGEIRHGLTYEEALRRARSAESFKWVEKSIWDQFHAERQSLSDGIAAAAASGVASIGRGAFGTLPNTIFDPETGAPFASAMAVWCPPGTQDDGHGNCVPV